MTRKLPAEAQTPSLKRSRSVVTCDGDTYAICQSAGDTVLQPCSLASDTDRRPASADPILIPPVAHILACAHEQRESCRAPPRKGAGMAPGCGLTDEAPTPRCNNSLAASSKELLAEAILAQPATSASASGQAHAGSAAAICQDDGTLESVRLRHASAGRTCATELPEPQPGAPAASSRAPAVVVFEPRAGMSGPPTDDSLEAGCWFGAKASKPNSVRVQAQAISVSAPVGLQSASSLGAAVGGITPVICAVDQGVQATLLSERTEACHMAVQATPSRADEAVQCTLLAVEEMASSARVPRREVAGHLQEAALPPPCTGAAERMRKGIAEVAQAREDWHRQIGVVQHFVGERIVPLLALCSRGPPEEALVSRLHCARSCTLS